MGLKFNNVFEVYTSFDTVQDIMSYTEQQLDKGISYEDRFHNVLQYLISLEKSLQQEIIDRDGL